MMRGISVDVNENDYRLEMRMIINWPAVRTENRRSAVVVSRLVGLACWPLRILAYHGVLWRPMAILNRIQRSLYHASDSASEASGKKHYILCFFSL